MRVTAFLTLMPVLCQVALGQGYTFTKIAENKDPQSGFASLPMLSDTGAVAYNLTSFVRNTPTSLPIGYKLDAYVFEKGASRRLGDPSLNTSVLDMNKSGTVLFAQAEKNGRLKLLLDSGGDVTEVENTETGSYASFAAGSLNDNGDVVFSALKDTGVPGIYVKTAGGETIPIAEGADLRFSYVGLEPRINNNGTVAYSDNAAGGAVYLSTGGSLANLTPGANMVFGTPQFSNPMLSSDDTVVFSVPNANPPDFPAGAVFKSAAGGALETVVKGTGTIPPQLRAVTINERKTIAYMSTTTNIGTFGIFYDIYVISNSSPVRVIRSGDSLFGSTTSLVGSLGAISSSRYLNNSRQLAFTYTMSDRTSGIALATPAGN